MVGALHTNPLELVETAVEVVDLAWSVFERRREHINEDGSEEFRKKKLEEELEHQRSEKEQLQAALEECQKSLMELQKGCASEMRGDNVVPNSECPEDLYEKLKKTVDSPAFLGKLSKLSSSNGKDENLLALHPEEGVMLDTDHVDPSGWHWVPDNSVAEPREEPNNLDDDSYVVVSQDDVVESIAIFVAKCISMHPEAKAMTPKELQESVAKALGKMEGKGMIQKLWGVSKLLYVAASWSATAVGLFYHPFYLGLIIKAVCSSSKLIIKMLV